jgi:hypothetical protein
MSGKLRINDAVGMRPSLEFRPLPHLNIDPAYQRSIDTGSSQKLIRRIAGNWNWDMCQPLVVAKREDGTLWVIDGQHRLAAARLRHDIYDLPCVIVPSASRSAEAKAFVALNQERRPLTALDLFKAALEAGDGDAQAIARAMAAAGLTLAHTTNYDSLKPGQIVNVGGLQRVHAAHGEAVVRDALAIGAAAFEGQALRYFGTIFPGIVAAVVALPGLRGARDIEFLAMVLGGGTQEDWVADIRRAQAAAPDLNLRSAAEAAVLSAVAEAHAEMGEAI